MNLYTEIKERLPRRKPSNQQRIETYIMDRTGQLRPGRPQGEDLVLENTLLMAMYPEAKLAEITVRGVDRMPGETKDVLASKLQSLRIHGERYRLVGSSGSLKYGTAYYAPEPLRSELLARFNDTPEYALAYFGILISPLYGMDRLSANVMVAPDHGLGTNDSRGWIARSVLERLHLPERFNNRAYQFRMAFGAYQAKGCFKIMEDDVAAALGATFVLPESAVKPGIEKLHHDTALGIDAFRWSGNVHWGIRDIARRVPYKSNYTLVQFATPSILRKEIVPFALAEIKKVKRAIEDGDYPTLLEIIGAEYHETDEDESARPLEHTALEALLKADGSGLLAQHPWFMQQLRRLLARWAYRLLTSGGFTMPARLLQDDGVLTMAGKNQIVWASDWLPAGRFLSDIPFQRGLMVRYPVYSFSQLLPAERLSSGAAAKELQKTLAGCSNITEEQALDLVVSQVRLPGTLTLNSSFAKLFQGDFDGDFCAVIPDSLFPQFVERRSSIPYDAPPAKNKTRKRSPKHNFEYVFLEAAGNQTGEVTNMNSELMAAGLHDLAKEIGEQIQVSIDAIKFNVKVDRKRLMEIKKQIPPGTASWISWKEARAISELPDFVPSAPSDVIAYLWNQLRPEISDVFTPKTASEFLGLVGGEDLREDMLREAKQIYTFYARNMQQSLAHEEALRNTYLMLKNQKNSTQKGTEAYKKVLEPFLRAKEALELYQAQAARDRANIVETVFKWSLRKTENRRAWAQVAWVLSARSKATGSFVFKTGFIPELVELLIESTGGNRRLLEVPYPGDGPVLVDHEGNLFVEHPSDGRKIWVHKLHRRFPCDFKTEVRDGALVLPGRLVPKTRKTFDLEHPWPDTPVTVSEDGTVKIPLPDGMGVLIPFKLPDVFPREFPAEIRDGKLILPYRISPRKKAE